jgi:hypothetical protein
VNVRLEIIHVLADLVLPFRELTGALFRRNLAIVDLSETQGDHAILAGYFCQQFRCSPKVHVNLPSNNRVQDTSLRADPDAGRWSYNGETDETTAK